ncbi:hypothetical protein D3C71_1676820 [compost metagenome]
MMRSSWQSCRLLIAGSVARRIAWITLLKPGSATSDWSTITIRPTWLVTPYGRMSSISGWAEVLVDGMTTPTRKR